MSIRGVTADSLKALPRSRNEQDKCDVYWLNISDVQYFNSTVVEHG